MGIRFKCPNGHDLHVKNFLAGKKGICPKCGERVRIPSPGNPGGGQVPAAIEKSPVGQNAKGKETVEATGNATTPQVTSRLPTMPMDAAVAQPGAGERQPPSAVDQGIEKHAREFSDAAWYVRAPSGEQYGPANDQLFRSWVDQGRVGAQNLVWREGWENWRSASEVLGEIQSTPPAPTPPPPTSQITPAANNVGVGNVEINSGANSARVDTAGIGPVAPPTSQGIQIETNKPVPSSRSRSSLMVLLLFAVCLILIVPLVFVFLNNS